MIIKRLIDKKFRGLWPKLSYKNIDVGQKQYACAKFQIEIKKLDNFTSYDEWHIDIFIKSAADYLILSEVRAYI